MHDAGTRNKAKIAAIRADYLAYDWNQDLLNRAGLKSRAEEPRAVAADNCAVSSIKRGRGELGLDAASYIVPFEFVLAQERYK